MGNYRFIQKLGQGTYGSVYLVHDNRKGAVCVMKKLRISTMSAAEINDCKREIEILSMLEHPNLIGYQRSFTRHGRLRIIMDYANNGDLHQMIKSQREIARLGGSGFSEDTILDWTVQIALGLQHMHRHRVLHRDLKSKNILLTTDGVVQLGDFGISRIMANTMEQARTQAGTPYYLSPEILNGLPYDSKTDMWSLGVVLYEMLTLARPFNDNSISRLSRVINRGIYPQIPRHYSHNIRKLLSNLLDCNPTTRLSVEELLDHPLLAPRRAKFLVPKGQKSMRSVVNFQNYESESTESTYISSPSVVAASNPQSPSTDDVNSALDPEASRIRNQSTIVIRDTTMDDGSEPDWDELQQPEHHNSILHQDSAQQPEDHPNILREDSASSVNKTTGSVDSKAAQLKALREYLEVNLAQDVLCRVMAVVASSSDGESKIACVKELVGSNHDVLPFLHTLIYLEQ